MVLEISDAVCDNTVHVEQLTFTNLLGSNSFTSSTNLNYSSNTSLGSNLLGFNSSFTFTKGEININNVHTRATGQFVFKPADTVAVAVLSRDANV
jgi:hypothetical protein